MSDILSGVAPTGLFRLRYYQDQAKAGVYVCWDTHQSTAVIMATGTGKTELYLSVAVELRGRVLVIAHRDYLLTQPIRRLERVGFHDVAIEKAGLRSEFGFTRAKVVFASIQSLGRPDRMAHFNPNDFDAVIVDEGHRAVSPQYRKVLDHFRTNKRLKVLIVTATPKRKDGVALSHVCESVAFEYGPKQAADEGWIVPLRFHRREVPNLDFSGIDLKGGDLDPEQVERALLEEKPLHHICASLADDRGPTIVFCPRVGVARAFDALMDRRYRRGRSAVLSQDSADEDRERAGKGLADGTIDYLFNVDIATEGYDVPELLRVVWACPTASLVKFTQGTGRVFRPAAAVKPQLVGDLAAAAARRAVIAESCKPYGHVVTFYPQNCRHQLCDPVDILGGDGMLPVVKAAAKDAQGRMAGGADGCDPEVAVEVGEAAVEFWRLLDARRASLKATATTVDHEYDGFGGTSQRTTSDAGPKPPAAAGTWPAGEAMSDGQGGWFRRQRIDVPEGVSKFRACVVIDLVKFGVRPDTAWGFSKGEATNARRYYQQKAAKSQAGQGEAA